MGHSIVIPRELESDLKTKATRLGMPMDLYVIEVLRQDVKSQIPMQKKEDRNARFLELTKELMPIIEAGMLVKPGSLGATEIIDAVRDEREAELLGSLQENH